MYPAGYPTHRQPAAYTGFRTDCSPYRSSGSPRIWRRESNIEKGTGACPNRTQPDVRNAHAIITAVQHPYRPVLFCLIALRNTAARSTPSVRAWHTERTAGSDGTASSRFRHTLRAGRHAHSLCKAGRYPLPERRRSFPIRELPYLFFRHVLRAPRMHGPQPPGNECSGKDCGLFTSSEERFTKREAADTSVQGSR